MTTTGRVGDWVVEMTRVDEHGGTARVCVYGYQTEYEATPATADLLVRHGYPSGTVRRRTDDEAGVGVKR